MKKKYLLFLFPLIISLQAKQLDGKKVFETYCWGCHHQSATAFGPSFSQIASKRDKNEIKAYVLSPKSMYKSFGYKRTVMTQLHLNDDELEAISKFVLKQKGK